MATARSCCDCSTEMKVLQRHPETQLPLMAWCAHCGGLWFSLGYLPRLLGQTVREEPFDAATDRRCTPCNEELSTLMLNGNIPAERCRTCGGLFLDHGELTELGGAEATPLGMLKKAERSTPELFGFDCARCGKRFPYSDGNLIQAGLACRGCTPKVTPMRVPVARDDTGRDVYSTVDLIGTLVELVFFFVN